MALFIMRKVSLYNKSLHLQRMQERMALDNKQRELNSQKRNQHAQQREETYCFEYTLKG